MALSNPNFNALPQLANIQLFLRFEEGAGAFVDESDNGNDFTNDGAGYGSTGKIGDCADFERADTDEAFIAPGAQTGLDYTGNFTIAGWVDAETLPGTLAFVYSHWENNGSDQDFRFGTNGATNKVYLQLTSNGAVADLTEIFSTDDLSATGFQHISCVSNGTDLRLYINGSLNCTPVAYSSGISANGADYVAGGSEANGGASEHNWDGLIDELLVWDTDLTASEIAFVASITTLKGYKLPTKGGFSGTMIKNWIFMRDAWDKHNELWKPKGGILVPA